MNYVEKNLLPSETVLYNAKIHWAIYLPGLFTLILAYIISHNTEENSDSHWGIFFTLFGIYLLIKAYTYTASTNFVITNMRVIAKLGWLHRQAIELRHEKVESLSLDQGILDRIFDKGSLILNGTGGGKIKVHSIAGPLDFRKQAMEAIGQKS